MFTVQYCTVQYFLYYKYCTVLDCVYCVIQYCTVKFVEHGTVNIYCSTVLYKYCTVLHCSIHYCTVLIITIQYCTLLQCTIHYITLFSYLLYDSTLCWVVKAQILWTFLSCSSSCDRGRRSLKCSNRLVFQPRSYGLRKFPFSSCRYLYRLWLILSLVVKLTDAW